MPDVTVWLIGAYAVFLLAVAWGIDLLGKRSAERSASWRTGNFVYHSDNDAWKCHEDKWLWPASFDPDKRVIRYVGQHEICGRCPVKDACSPTPGPRELTRQLDPWPFSEAGRFQRGIALAVAVVAVALPAGALVGSHGPLDAVVLGTVIAVVLGAGVWPLARHLWRSPANFPEHLQREGMAETAAGHAAVVPLDAVGRLGRAGGVPDTARAAPALTDRHATRWASDRRRLPGED